VKNVRRLRENVYERILLPVDGSDDAERAAKRGLELARTHDATAEALHVVDRKALALTRTSDEKRRLRERGEAALESVESLASERGQHVTTTLTEGNPAAEISEYAAERDADLVVVGRQGMTGVGRRLLGGVTEQVLSRGDVPVFVVPDDDRDPESDDSFSRVLLATDGSDPADRATPHAAALAANYGASVHVLNVVDLQGAGGAFDVGGLESEFVDRLEERGRDTVDRVAAEIDATAPDVPIRTAVERTTSHRGAADGIVEYVAENGIDLVVMGSQGRSTLKRQLLGSVASTVLRTVDVPVLVAQRRS